MFIRSPGEKEYWLIYRGEDGSEGTYVFGRHKFERASREAIPDRARVFSATSEDMRLDQPRQRLSYAKLERLARQESGEGGRMRIIRLPKPASIWFTSAARLRGLNYFVFPLAATLEGMLFQSGRQKPALVGVSFGQEDPPDFILFVSFRETGQAQVLPAIFPESVEEATVSALHDARLPEDASVVMFAQEDLWASCARATPYPVQDPFLGMDPQVAAMGFAGISVLALAATAGYWKYQSVRHEALQTEYGSVSAEVDEIKRRIAGRLGANPEAVAAALREDWRRVLDEAVLLWRENGRIETEFAGRRATHSLVFRIRETDGSETRWLERDKVLSLMKSGSLPQGCQAGQVLLTGNTNEIKVQYVCVHPGDDLFGAGR